MLDFHFNYSAKHIYRQKIFLLSMLSIKFLDYNLFIYNENYKKYFSVITVNAVLFLFVKSCYAYIPDNEERHAMVKVCMNNTRK